MSENNLEGLPWVLGLYMPIWWIYSLTYRLLPTNSPAITFNSTNLLASPLSRMSFSEWLR